MKRETYEIRVNGNLTVKKHAWNSAMREIPKQVKAILKPGETAQEIASEINRPDKYTFLGMKSTWLASNGKEITVEIEKI